MKTVSYNDYSALLNNSRIIIPGKVFQLHDGNILKLFRLKRFFSSGRLYPFARRFAKNAEKLNHLQIPTVRVLSTYRIPDLEQTAVLYKKLEGTALDDRLADNPVNNELAGRLAVFMANLHKKGVYFRSIHFGNIIILPNDEFGLIDILDMKVHRTQLTFRKRLRNFNHILRNNADRKRMRPVLDVFLNQYKALSPISKIQAAKIRETVIRLMDEPGHT
jgi:hypothetical protein